MGVQRALAPNCLHTEKSSTPASIVAERTPVMRDCGLLRLVSIALLSFGLGILLSFFVPAGVLVVIESLLIIAIGCMTLMRPMR